ncbi:MAG: TadE/TadG family type IV pilus assembly protein, partial [Candidatus Dormibacteria bacterium]
MKRRSRAGQSAVELALALPFILGLLAVTLQGGLIISDQVQLEHYTYEGTQWALSNLDTATIDAGATPGTISQHVYAQLCGGATSAPANTGTRFCAAGAGNLHVTTTQRPTPVSLLPHPWVDAGAACTVKNWQLAVSPGSQTVTAGGSATYTVTLTESQGAGQSPTVKLSLSGYPATVTGAPVINPPTVTTVGAGGNTATITVDTKATTVAGTYTLSVGGVDQCNGGPSSGASTAALVIQGSVAQQGGGTNQTVLPPQVLAVTSSILPVCINAGVSFTISGANFQPGATVVIAQDPAAQVIYNGPSSLVATYTTGIPTFGNFGVTVTNPDGTSATLLNSAAVANCTGGGGAGAPPGP